MPLLFVQQWFSEQVLKAIGWTLVHSLWQGLLAAVLAGVIIIGTRRSKARLRYNLFGMVLGLFVIAAVITFLRLLNSGPVTGTTPGDRAFVNSTETVASHISGTYAADTTTTIDKFIHYFDRNADLFVIIWAIFFFIHCIKLGTGLAGVHRMRSYKVFKSPVEWSSRLKQLCKIVGVKETVQLMESGLVKVPVAIGMLKPVILVPLGLLSQLPPEQVETILVHELAHIRRKDYFINILQRLAEAVFFFNPALLWISSLIRQEREACCDDIVIANTTHKGNYLEALVSFQEYSLPSTGYAMAIGSKRNFLLNRVKRIITHENQKLNSMEKLFLAMGLIVVTAFTFIPKDQPLHKTIAPAIQSQAIIEQKATADEAIAPGDKPFVRKENKRTAYKMPINKIPADTVPSKKEKAGYEDLRFPGISSNINDDGKTKTENITVTDQDGKKYSYTKVNDKVTSLTVDGKSIPESEFDNYSQLIDQIERSMQERQLMKLKELAVRRMTLEKRSEERRNQLFEKQMLNQHQLESRQLQKKFLFEQNKQLNEEQRKNLENKRKETKKLLQLLKEKRVVPMVDGREVSINSMIAPVITQSPVTTSVGSVCVSLSPVQKEMQAIAIKQAVNVKMPVKAVLNVQLNATMRPVTLKKAVCNPTAPARISTEVKPVPTTPSRILPVKQRVVS